MSAECPPVRKIAPGDVFRYYGHHHAGQEITARQVDVHEREVIVTDIRGAVWHFRVNEFVEIVHASETAGAS